MDYLQGARAGGIKVDGGQIIWWGAWPIRRHLATGLSAVNWDKRRQDVNDVHHCETAGAADNDT